MNSEVNLVYNQGDIIKDDLYSKIEKEFHIFSDKILPALGQKESFRINLERLSSKDKVEISWSWGNQIKDYKRKAVFSRCCISKTEEEFLDEIKSYLYSLVEIVIDGTAFLQQPAAINLSANDNVHESATAEVKSPIVGKKVGISVKELYAGYGDGDSLFYCSIKHTQEDDREYYDLYTGDLLSQSGEIIQNISELVCCDGEECRVMQVGSFGIFLRNIDSGKYFLLTDEEYELAAFDCVE